MLSNVGILKGFRQIVVVLLLLATALGFSWIWKNREALLRKEATRQFAQITINTKTYEVILSSTPEQIQLGLSYRSSIGADGMLFVFPQRHSPVFWMYEMRFPLDFIWIDGSSIVALHENVLSPQPGAQVEDITRVSPGLSVTSVLEVPAGFIRQEGIKIGNQVSEVTEIQTKVW